MQYDNYNIVFDIEQLSNLHTCTFYIREKDEKFQFVIHELQDDRIAYFKFLNRCTSPDTKLIGFNCVNYDYPMLHFMLLNKSKLLNCSLIEFNKLMYNQSQLIINSERSAVYNPKINIIDLYKIHHYDNKAKRTSLKFVEFGIRWLNVQDMPIHHSAKITSQAEIQCVLDYNLNDVLATNKFYDYTIGQTDNEVYKGKNKVGLRDDFSKKYKSNFSNASDSKIGEEIVLKLYCEKTDKDLSEVKQLRTIRTEIDLAECVPDLKFEIDQFKLIYDWFKSQKIKQTKGVFKDLELDRVKTLIKYMNTDIAFDENYGKAAPLGKKRKKKTKRKQTVKNLNVIVNDCVFIYGAGGIHQCNKPGTYLSDDVWAIIDVDVASLYPNLAKVRKLFPQHLGYEFLDVYVNDMIIPRLAAKKNKDHVTNEGLKLSLNSVNKRIAASSSNW